MGAWPRLAPPGEDFVGVLEGVATVELGMFEVVSIGSTGDPPRDVLEGWAPSAFDVEYALAVDRITGDEMVVIAVSTLVSTATCVVVDGAVSGLLLVTVTPGQSALRPRPL